MFSFLAHIFVVFIYQPFFNLLVFIYWLLGIGGKPDMGVAVIILSIIIRILLLPITLAGDRTEAERHEITQKLKKLKEEYANEPIKFRKERKKIMRASKKTIFSTLISK